MGIPFSTAPQGIDDKSGGVEPGGVAAHPFLKGQPGSERGPEILNTRHHVMEIDVVRVNIDVPQTPDMELHDAGLVVHPALQHGLAANQNAAFRKPGHGVLGNPGDLPGMVEVGMHRHILVHAATGLHHMGQRIQPSLVRQDFLGQHTQPFGSDAQPPHVGHPEQPVPDRLKVFGLQIERVTAADHDVLQLRTRLDVFKSLLPPRVIGMQPEFLGRGLHVPTHRVTARAETAVNRTGVQRQKQCLVPVPVRHTGDGGILLLVERVKPQHRVVRDLP